MVLTVPSVFGYNVEGDMEPRLLYLEKRLLLSTAELKKMVLTLPAVFGYNVKDNVEPKLLYLEKRLSLSPDQLRKFIVTSPSVFAYKIESMERNMKYFQTIRFFGRESSETHNSQTPFLSYDITNNLEPTIALFEGLLGPVDGLSLISKYPRLLSASVSKRVWLLPDVFTKKTAYDFACERQIRWLDG